ncbi:uncharacterized protein si:dkey-7i4.24 [Rhinichthys klamathensis goyatoka]|uniref:uncharacterized protein si:dkey-7i4.24 n=1 Tax=Rhinichthys klamathensis goyatoka TaxID=3034132 RepID=UPI0024B585A8|nr:uncharacterized protein si:dkey-7i4.24 [Rhinichthys klamathensis goyatoka]
MFFSPVAVSQWSPAFVEDLLPAAEKTALLYRLSYLCLASFPSLERLIRRRAVETQLLFGSSDATMLKCILTSENLVQSLFPMLANAVEKNKPVLAVKFLGKARVWIKDIITDVDRIVEKYDLHNKDVASSTSDVVKEKKDTDKKITEQDHKLKQTEKTLDDLKSELQKTTQELDETEKKINRKIQEIQVFARSITKASRGLGIFAAIVPFVGLIVKSIYKAVRDPGNVARMKALEAELNRLLAEKTALRQKQWQVQLKIVDGQMKVAKASFERNSIPDPVHLKDVQSGLTKIQAILIQLKHFWESVAQMLDYLEQKTFVGEDLIEDLAELKDEFLASIKSAEEAWNSFGAGCKKASVIFKLQTKDAYRFLEVSPSSLSKEAWEKEYESVKKRLEKIDPPQSVTSSATPALSK